MLTDLREINRLLLAIKQIAVKDLGVKKEDIVQECKKVVLGGHFPNHNDTIIFCLQCRIIERKQELIRPSLLGIELLKLNDENNYELNHGQKDLLIKNCFLEGLYKKPLISLLKQFRPDVKRQTFVYSSKENIPLSVVPIFLEYFKQCNIIQEIDHLLIVNPDYSKHVSLVLHPESSTTEEELMERLEINNIVGKVAEKIVHEYEKNRLRNEFSAMPESDLVKIISGIDVGAGYDIESFDGKSETLLFDRFIEVKGSTGHDFSLYWTRNEIKKARELGSKYWIYFVPEVDVNTGTHKGEIIKISNPIENILQNNQYVQECMKTWIKMKNTSSN